MKLLVAATLLFLSSVAHAEEPVSFCACEATNQGVTLNRFFHFGAENWEKIRLAAFYGPQAQVNCEARLYAEPLCSTQRP